MSSPMMSMLGRTGIYTSIKVDECHGTCRLTPRSPLVRCTLSLTQHKHDQYQSRSDEKSAHPIDPLVRLCAGDVGVHGHESANNTEEIDSGFEKEGGAPGGAVNPTVKTRISGLEGL